MGTTHLACWLGMTCLVVVVVVPAFGEELPLPKPLGKPKHPHDNPATPSKIALGRRLFHDPRLSRTGRISCSSCHDPARGFSNGKRFGEGVGRQKGTRHVPTLFNVAYSPSLFWDGRASTLEEQALQPIQNPQEMDMPLKKLVTRLNGVASYRKEFTKAFGGKITSRRVAQALATYQRTIVSRNTPFDRYLKGDRKALPPAALRGMKLFYGQARCLVCHQGHHLTDGAFHNIGVPAGKLAPDVGRRKVTGRKQDHGKFKTPTLREVGRTAPYMHNGHFSTLKDVVTHYNFGGVTDEENDHRDEQLQVLYLSEQQVDDLVQFLAVGLTSKAK